MRYRLELAAEDEDYSVLDRGRHGDGGYRIIDTQTNSIVGYLWYVLSGDRVYHIDMIEIIEKGEGTGTRFIKELFDLLDARALEGTVLEDEYMNAYNFWESMGADMNLGEDDEGNPYEAEDLMLDGYPISFWLER